MSHDREFEAWMNTMEALGSALFGSVGGMHNRNRGYSEEEGRQPHQDPGQGESKWEAPRTDSNRSPKGIEEPLFSLRFNLDLFTDRLVQNSEARWKDPRR